MAAQARSSVAYAAVFVTIVFLVVFFVLWAVALSSDDAFKWAAIASVAVLAAVCAVFSDTNFRSAALVAGSAFAVFACVVLFLLWADDDDSLETLLVALLGIVSFVASLIFLWRHNRSEPAYRLWRHAVAGIPLVGPVLTLWGIL
jgi:O-antigen/teichoic acid export membrane protein